MDLGNVMVVLHRPSSAENIGSVARAMKNFGLSRLAIVAPPSWTGLPRGGGPQGAREEVLLRARKTARRASDLLDAASIHGRLRDAVAGTTWACGTTSRVVEGRPSLDPRELARELLERAAAGPVAVVFGEERRGLSDAELELCQAVSSIPTHDAYDSMNLAQAVAVVAYEIGMAEAVEAEGERRGSRTRLLRSEREEWGGSKPPHLESAPARHATVEALWERTAALLAAAGYLNPQNPEHILADWRRLLARAEPTQREVELLLAGARALERKLKVG